MKFFLLILLILKSTLFAEISCLGESEKKRVNEQIEFHQTYYSTMFDSKNKFVDSIINCMNQDNLSNYVCKDLDLLVMFRLITRTEYEKSEQVNMQLNSNKELDVNDIWKKWNNIYNIRKRNLNNLCYDLKNTTSNTFSDNAPYYYLNIENKRFYYYQDLNKFVIQGESKDPILLNNFCEILTNEKQKGYWYKENNKYFLILDNKKIEFITNQQSDFDKISCTEDKVKELMKK